MSMMWDTMRRTKAFNFLKKMYGQFDLPIKAIGANEDETWEKVQYETAYQHMKEQLDQPMMVGEEPNHFFVDLNLMEHWKGLRGKFEENWDKKADAQHAQYWVKTIPRRNEMIQDRNKKMLE